MPFVVRDAEGKIIAVYEASADAASEEVAADDPQVVDFLLRDTDADMARITEDLIETLIEKNAIMLTDLPRSAQEKLMTRRRLRDRMSALVGLIHEDDIL